MRGRYGLDNRLSISKEHGSSGRTDNGEVLQVEYRDLDLVRDIHSVLKILHKAWLVVQGEDKSGKVDITLDGNMFTVPEIEAILYWYLHEGYKVKVASYDNEIVGILVYNWIFEGIMAIRMFYVAPEYLRTRTGLNLINSSGKAKKLIFQTRRDLPPNEMFRVTKGRETKLCEDDLLITWTMSWEA